MHLHTVFCKSPLRIRTERWSACSVQSISLLAGCFILYTLPQDLILAYSGCLLSPPQFLRAFGVLGEVCRGQTWKWSEVRSESGVRSLVDFSGDQACAVQRIRQQAREWGDKVCSWYWSTRVVKKCPLFTTVETHGTGWALQWIMKFLLVNMKWCTWGEE